MAIEAELLAKAKNYKLNVSHFSNEALKEVIELLETRSLVRSPGFEPGIISLEGQLDSESFWSDYRKYLLAYRSDSGRPLSKGWVYTLFGNAHRYAHCLTDKDFSAVAALPVTRRQNVVKALSFFSKRYGCYELFQSLMRNRGIKWHGTSSAQLVAGRLKQRSSPDKFFSYVREVKQTVPRVSLFMDFAVVAGIRLVEAVDSWNLIRSLEETDLYYYYNPVNQGLEHFWFDDIFLRPHKNVFFTFMHEDMVKQVRDSGVRWKWDTLAHLIIDAGLHSDFGGVREFWGSYMTKWLSPEQIDFLQGRIGKKVFMTNYYNPGYVEGLARKVFEGADLILEKIKV